MADTITADKLCALTGLTDRRHRQLAAEGFFPPPIKGEYQLTLTVSGLFRYYRESYQKMNRTLAERREIKINREIELLDQKIAQGNEELAPMGEVDRVWRGACIAARQIIQAADIPHQIKEELCNQFQKVNVGDYYQEAGEADSESERGLPADPVAADANG